MYDTADDDILDAVVKTATTMPQQRTVRKRRETRNKDRKSCKYYMGGKSSTINQNVGSKQYEHVVLYESLSQSL